MDEDGPRPGYAVSVEFHGTNWIDLLDEAASWLRRQRPRVYNFRAITCTTRPYYEGEELVLTIYYE